MNYWHNQDVEKGQRSFIGQYEKVWNRNFAGYVRQFHLISVTGRRKTYKFSSPQAAQDKGWRMFRANDKM